MIRITVEQDTYKPGGIYSWLLISEEELLAANPEDLARFQVAPLIQSMAERLRKKHS